MIITVIGRTALLLHLAAAGSLLRGGGGGWGGDFDRPETYDMGNDRIGDRALVPGGIAVGRRPILPPRDDEGGGGRLLLPSNIFDANDNGSQGLATTAVDTAERMRYCGVPGRCGAFGGDAVPTPIGSKAGVRCCSDDQSLGWPYKCRSIPEVYGESNVPTCYMDSTFDEAVAVCENAGGRLCSGEELLDRCTAGTGCSLNKALVWGCTAPPAACSADRQCCSGYCDGGYCVDVAAPGTNLVWNPGFEDGLANWYANSGTIELESAEMHSGTQSVLMKDRTQTWMAPQQDMLGKMQPNATYRLSCWAKLKGLLGSTDKLRITLRIEDDAGVHYRGVWDRDINDSSWTYVEGDVTVDVTGTMTAVYLYVQGPAVGEEYWVDDVSVVLLEDPPAPEPTDSPTDAPTSVPTNGPTDAPTDAPTSRPSDAPTNTPTDAPTKTPTDAPTTAPTDAPTNALTDAPTDAPTNEPTDAPTRQPTDAPTDTPTKAPTNAPTQDANNVVMNPGFEDGLTDWYANSGTMTMELDSVEMHSGSQSVLAKGRTQTWMGPQQDMMGKMQPNATYRVSCWARLRGLFTSTDRLLLTLRIEDDNGPHWRNFGADINTGGWTYVEGELTVDVVGTLTALYLFAEGPAIGKEFWLDDVSAVVVGTSSPMSVPTEAPTNGPTNNPSKSPSLAPTDASTTNTPTEPPTNQETNLVLNPGFEDGLGNWYANSGTIELESVETHSGTQSVLAKQRTQTWMAPQQDMYGRLQPNATYRFSCWAKLMGLLGSTDKLSISLRIEDDAGVHYRGVWDRDINDSSWTFVEGDVTVDVTGTMTAVYLYVQGPAVGEEYWVDDVSAVLVGTSSPTDAPTKAPTIVAPMTGSPTANSDYGNGPFVTLGTSSELVTIPRPPPPLPGSDVQSDCPHWEGGLLSWHDPSTWPSGNVPQVGESVTLPPASKVVIRQAVAQELGVITIPATSELVFDENAGAPITLDVAGMDVQGAIRAGSETCPYGTELVITLHGSRPNDLDIYGTSSTAVPTYKGISVNGGVISFHGRRHYPTWTRLAESVPIGQSYLLVQERVDWEAGQEIVLVTTAIHDSRAWHQNEVLTISSVVDDPVASVGSAIYFTRPVEYAHIANNGYQAEVGLLSRNIKVQGAADDSEPTDPDSGGCTGNWHHGTNFQPCPYTYTTGFGGHIMVHSGGKGFMEGVELYRMGQTNVLGRYPFHWHLLENGCADCYFRGNAIHRSFYRCISIHGTHNVTVSENVAYDVSGYCYYLEDGVEEDNTISFNLAAHIHPVSNVVANGGGGQTINVVSQNKDLILPADVTASGYYLTNLRNDIVGNAASGGWAGFALPILHNPIGPNRNLNMRPANRLTKIFDGNTAHSTAWWWRHTGAFYSGGSLYYSSADPTLLEYNAGRDQSKGSRSPCLVDKCNTGNNDCGNYCYEGERAWFRLTNNKVFLTPSPGVNSWSGRMEIIHFEAHDVALGLEALESGFAIDDLLVECRSGEGWVMPGNPSGTTANGFFWYDTGQEHIITSATFRNCGARNSQNVYDTSPSRGCDNNSFNGCNTGSTVWGLLTHSDQFTPEIMQATRGITYENCGRRFKLEDFADQNVITSVSGRNQNWADIDGTASGLNEPTIIGSGLADAGHWWSVDDEAVSDPEGPLTFIKVNDGPERGLGHIRLRWKDELHNTVGSSSCLNGQKKSGNNLLCPTIGRIRHIGSLFDSTNDPTGGLPITANAEVAGLVGGFGWVLELDDGPPKNLRIDQVEVDSSTPLLLVIPYPLGTSFSITAHAAYCSSTTTHSCTEQFSAVDSAALVRQSQGNTYFFDSTMQLLYVRIIQTPQTYTGDNLLSPTAQWHLWDLDDLTTISWDPKTHALDRFSFNGITLPKFAHGPYLEISADCNEGSVSGHCATTPSYVEPQVCPSGYVQVSYDKCCVSPGSTDCYDPTLPPTSSPTPPPTFGQTSNLVLNPGFENGLAEWYANSGTIDLEPVERHDGIHSALAKDRTQTWMGPQQDMNGRLRANTTYRLSCWAKLKGLLGSTDKLSITLRIEDDAGVHYRGVSGRDINDSSWTYVEGDVTVDVTGTMTAVYLYVQGPAVGEEYWIDDVSAVLST